MCCEFSELCTTPCQNFTYPHRHHGTRPIASSMAAADTTTAAARPPYNHGLHFSFLNMTVAADRAIFADFRTAVRLHWQAGDRRHTVFWWFEQGGRYVRCEIRFVAEGYALMITDPDGIERVEEFNDSQQLSHRQNQLERELAGKGWTGPYGWNI